MGQLATSQELLIMLGNVLMRWMGYGGGRGGLQQVFIDGGMGSGVR